MNASAVPAHLRGQEVDVRWVMRELLDEQRVTREEFNVISTTPRENKELNWHPLQVVAKYRLVDRAHGQRIMDVEFLSDWLAAKSGLPLYHIDPLKVDVDQITRVMSYAFAERHGIVAVESHRDRGARLAIWGLDDGAVQRRAATPFIGTRFRWLAPLGAADLDGDGRMEIAYVDRPHLARVLRVWRYEAGDGLREVAQLQGLSNHRIGAPDIAGGIRDCGQGPEMILADAQWRRLVAVTLNDGTLTRRDLGPHRGRDSFGAAMGCDRPR